MLAFLKEKKKELDKIGSVIFPMKGNPEFEKSKTILRNRMSLVKRFLEITERNQIQC